MPLHFLTLPALRHVSETLGFAAAGGLALGLIGVPAGYLSGAIAAVAVAALAGRSMQMPTWLTRVIFVMIGVSLGAVVTPATLHGMATYPLSIAVLIGAMTVVAFVCAEYLRKVHGWDKTSAYLGAAPGGLSQVMALAAEVGADLRGVAIVQTMRVVIVAVGLPAAMAVFGLIGPSARGLGGALSVDILDELAILIALSAIVGTLAHRLKFPGGLLFGAMFTSAVLHGSGLIQAVMPWWAANTAMIALGAVTGSRFANTPLLLLTRFMAAAVGSFAVSALIAVIFVFALVSLVPLKLPEVLIAFAPGSVDAMMLLALALHLDPVYVGAHHVTRIFLVSLAMPFVARHHARGHKTAPSAKPPQQPPFQD